jgi:maleate cis-trans isomerase
MSSGYGHRARIGYTSPPLTSEIFPYEFYKIAPDGVTLLLTTLDVWDHTSAELQDSHRRTLRAAKAMGQAGADLIILGGGPVLGAKGADKVGDLVKAAEDAAGVPVTTVLTAYAEALRRVTAKKVVSVEVGHAGLNDMLERAGFQVLGKQAVGPGKPMVDSTRVPSDLSLATGRELVKQHPDADTLWVAWPHRATVDRIEAMEQELGVNVVSATQAIVWHGLRRCKINDAIQGYGRLLRL